MDLDELSREIDRLGDWTTAWRQTGGADDEAVQALDTTLEELRVASDELGRLGDRLVFVQRGAEAERRRYSDLFDLAPVGYIVTDAFGAVHDANRAAVELLNIEPTHLVGKPLACFFPASVRPAFRAELVRLGRAGRLEGYQTRICPRKRPVLDVVLSAAASHDLDGRLQTIHWAVHDITRRVLAEQRVHELNAELEERVLERTEELREQIRGQEQLLIATHQLSSARGLGLLDLVHGLDAVIWRADAASGRYSFVSRRAEELLGYPCARWLDDPDFWWTLVHPDDRDWVFKNRQNSVAEDRDHETEYRMIAADGRAVWFRESVRLWRDPAGCAGELRGLMVNVTRRKRVERQLYTDRRQLSEELNDLKYLHDLLGRLSPTAELEPLLEEALGSAAGLLGAESGAAYVRDRGQGDWRLAAALNLPAGLDGLVERVPPWSPWRGRVLAIDEPVVVEDVLAVPGHGAHLPVIHAGGFRGLFSLPLVSRGEEPLGCLVFLFAEPHRPPERQARLAGEIVRKAGEFVESALLRREVLEADRRKDEALATLAHELRNPLAAILHATEVLRRPAAPDIAAEARDVVERQARSMARLVEDLLDSCRLGGRQATLRMEPVDLAAVAARAAESVRPETEARGIRLELGLPPEPAWTVGDPGRLEQIAVNLLANAVKFTEPGGTVGLTVEVEAEAEADGLALRVRDTGTGIAPEMLPRIFDRFVQGETRRGGLGIGLALVKGLAELHGGSVSAQSAGAGLGSEFVVRLPRGLAPDPDLNPEPESVSPADAGPRRVLLVDDHADTTRVLARLLRSAGHEVRVAADGPSAIAAARADWPDVVFLDLGLPGMNGLEVTRRLRELAGDGPDAPRIVALTGHGAEDDLRRSREAGCDGHLVKPVDSATLLASLETARRR